MEDKDDEVPVRPGLTIFPNNPVPGTCMMHASSVDLSVTSAALRQGPNPPVKNIFVPTPNHDHVVDDSRTNTGPIWWEVRPVLIMQQSDWPAPDGSSGITSSKAMDDAEAAGRAIEVGSNFFLFFSSELGSMSAHAGHGLHFNTQPQLAQSESHAGQHGSSHDEQGPQVGHK